MPEKQGRRGLPLLPSVWGSDHFSHETRQSLLFHQLENALIMLRWFCTFFFLYVERFCAFEKLFQIFCNQWSSAAALTAQGQVRRELRCCGSAILSRHHSGEISGAASHCTRTGWVRRELRCCGSAVLSRHHNGEILEATFSSPRSCETHARLSLWCLKISSSQYLCFRAPWWLNCGEEKLEHLSNLDSLPAVSENEWIEKRVEC